MRVILILTMVVGAACGRRAADLSRPGAGMISVEWTGKLHGSFTAPVTARWCAADTLLEVLAARGDTSVGFSLLARDSVRAETYVVNETQNFTPGRPQARLALRMLGEVNLLGFDGMGGQVIVTRGTPGVSGTFDVRLRPLGSTDTLQLKGSFDRLQVAPAAGLCGRADKPRNG